MFCKSVRIFLKICEKTCENLRTRKLHATRIYINKRYLNCLFDCISAKKIASVMNIGSKCLKHFMSRIFKFANFFEPGNIIKT